MRRPSRHGTRSRRDADGDPLLGRDVACSRIIKRRNSSYRPRDAYQRSCFEGNLDIPNELIAPPPGWKATPLPNSLCSLSNILIAVAKKTWNSSCPGCDVPSTVEKLRRALQ
jgi:hypothetical protein